MFGGYGKGAYPGVKYGLSVVHQVSMASSLSVRNRVIAGGSDPGRGPGLSVADFLELGSCMSLRSFGRFGSASSVFDCFTVASTMSCRSYARLGSRVSLYGASGASKAHQLIFGGKYKSHPGVSCVDALRLGSSCSLRCKMIFGHRRAGTDNSGPGRASLSLFDQFRMGSSLSIRAAVKAGSMFSCAGLMREFTNFDEDKRLYTCSVVHRMTMGSALSIRVGGRSQGLAVGGGLSVMQYVSLGSSMSIRGGTPGSPSRNRMALGSGGAGNGHSVFDFMAMGSTCSIRGMVRMGSSLSVSSFHPTDGGYGDWNKVVCGGTQNANQPGNSFGLSIVDHLTLSSCFSLRSMAYISPAHTKSCYTSIYDCFTMGSAMSIRNNCRAGSNFSLIGQLRIGGVGSGGLHGEGTGTYGLSVVNCVHFGSSISVRHMSTKHSNSFARGGLCVGRKSSSSVMDYVSMSSTFSLRGPFRCGTDAKRQTLSVLNFAQMGSTMSIRQFCKVGSMMSILPKAGNKYNYLRLGGHSGDRLSVLETLHVGSTLSCRCAARMSSAVSLMSGTGQMLRTGPGFNLSVFDQLLLGSSCSVRYLARCSSSVSVMSSVNRKRAVYHSGSVSIFDCFNLGSRCSIRSHVRVGCEAAGGCKMTSAFGAMSIGSNLSVRAYTRLSSGVSFVGGAGQAFFGQGVFKISLIQQVTLGSSMSIRNQVRIGQDKNSAPGLSIYDQLVLGSSLSIRGHQGSCYIGRARATGENAREQPQLSVLSCVNFGSSLSIRRRVVMCGPESATERGGLSIATTFQLGSSMSLRSHVRIGTRTPSAVGHPTCSVEDRFLLGSSLSIRGRIQVGSANAAKPHCNFSVVSFVNMGSNLSVRGQVRFGKVAGQETRRSSVFDFVAMSSQVSLRQFIRLGSSTSLFHPQNQANRNHPNCVLGKAAGSTHPGLNHSVMDYLTLGSNLSMRGTTSRYSALHAGTTDHRALTIFGFANFGSSVSLRNYIRHTSALSVSGALGVGRITSLSVMNSDVNGFNGCILGSSMSLRNVLRVGGNMRNSCADFLNCGSTLSMRWVSRVGSAMSLAAPQCMTNQRKAIVASSKVSVMDYVNLSSTCSLRGFFRGGKASSSTQSQGNSVMGTVLFGSGLSLRAAFRLQSGVSVVGPSARGGARLGNALTAFDSVNLSSTCSVRSWVRLGHNGRQSMLSCFDSLGLGSSISLRGCVTSSGSAISIAGINKIMGDPIGFFMGSNPQPGMALNICRTGNPAVSIVRGMSLGSSVSLRDYIRVGKGSCGRPGLSVYDYLAMGSSLSLRQMFRCGSTISLAASTKAGQTAKAQFVMGRTASGKGHYGFSVADAQTFGSSFSVRGIARVGSRCSLIDHFLLGSTLSMRSFHRHGSSLSVIATGSEEPSITFARGPLAGQPNCFVSMYDAVHIGSSVSIRSMLRVGKGGPVNASSSVLSYVSLGSSFSLRSSLRIGRGSGSGAYPCSPLSVLDSMNFGSSVSVRAFVRLGSTLSIQGAGNNGFQNSEIMRIGGLRLGTSLDTTPTPDRQYLNFYVTPSATATEVNPMRVYSTNQAGADTVGGGLHGTWTTEVSNLHSDRRLKVDVKDLISEFSEIDRQSKGLPRSKYATRPGSGSASDRDAELALDLVRKLRPVSFLYKGDDAQNKQSKHSRFGFIAQEIERVIPNVVHDDEGNGFKYVRYTDLVAVLTMGLQVLDSVKVTRLEQRVASLYQKVDDDLGLGLLGAPKAHAILPSLTRIEDVLIDRIVSQIVDSMPEDAVASDEVMQALSGECPASLGLTEAQCRAKSMETLKRFDTEGLLDMDRDPHAGLQEAVNRMARDTALRSQGFDGKLLERRVMDSVTQSLVDPSSPGSAQDAAELEKMMKLLDFTRIDWSGLGLGGLAHGQTSAVPNATGELRGSNGTSVRRSGGNGTSAPELFAPENQVLFNLSHKQFVPASKLRGHGAGGELESAPVTKEQRLAAEKAKKLSQVQSALVELATMTSGASDAPIAQPESMTEDEKREIVNRLFADTEAPQLDWSNLKLAFDGGAADEETLAATTDDRSLKLFAELMRELTDTTDFHYETLKKREAAGVTDSSELDLEARQALDVVIGRLERGLAPISGDLQEKSGELQELQSGIPVVEVDADDDDGSQGEIRMVDDLSSAGENRRNPGLEDRDPERLEDDVKDSLEVA
jgi:hypothetical protein